jgi:hypothetical protein
MDAAAPGALPADASADQLAALAGLLGSPNEAGAGPDASSSRDGLKASFTEAEAAIEAAPSPLIVAYAHACAERSTEPFAPHLEALRGVPDSLYVRINTRRTPRAAAGGAALAARPGAAPPALAQLEALLHVASTRSAAGSVLLLDHLDLSGAAVPAEALAALAAAAARLGPWWRLRSLALRGCGLGGAALRTLATPAAATLLWNLERLDLAGNPGLGADAAALGDGLFHLWRLAPLRALDLAGAALAAPQLLAALRMARAAAPAAPTLECLRLGPPPAEAGASFPAELGVELGALAAAAPRLAALTVQGLGAAARAALEDAWTTAAAAHGVDSAVEEAPDGALRFAAGAAVAAPLALEAPPADHHVLPGPKAPSAAPAASGRRVLDDWTSARELAPAAAAAGAPRAAATALPPRPPPRAPRAAPPPRAHRGGRANELPAQETLLGSCDEDDADLRAEASEEDEEHLRYYGAAGAAAGAEAPAASGGEQPEPFKLRDGALDGDSVAGARFRRAARAAAAAIADERDRARARSAYRIWEACAVNAWDRRRWAHPAHDQHDEPHVLGQLNLLLDLLERHGAPLGFPFPGRRPGGGAAAFEVAEAPRPEVRIQRRAQAAGGERRAAAAAAAAPAQKKRKSRFVDDGGRGRGSDDERAAPGDASDEFIASDGEESGEESGSASESGASEKAAAAQPLPRRRGVVLDSSSEDDAAPAAQEQAAPNEAADCAAAAKRRRGGGSAQV